MSDALTAAVRRWRDARQVYNALQADKIAAFQRLQTAEAEMLRLLDEETP